MSGWIPRVQATSIRTTSPGTIVFRGGAVVPRYFFIEETAGPYRVQRHRMMLYAAYSPTPRTLLEIEAPFDRVHVRGPRFERDFTAAGNTTIWGKYRFYRVVEEWGDRHAAVRAGLALPTGVSQRGLPSEISAQLQPSSGAWSPTFDLTFGSAIRRFVYHLNAQQTFAVERGGGRPGHTTRGNLDLEYVFLPRDYKEPGRELFGVLELSALHMTSMESRGVRVPGTGGTQFLIAPGLQYIATRRIVLEASYQFPVYSSMGPWQLRQRRNVLIGLRWLF